MDSQLAVKPEPGLTLTQDQQNILKRTVAQGASDDEFKMFMYLSQQYNLDPFKKELFFIKYNDRVSIQTSRDGYLKIAMSSPDYEGLEAYTVCEGDTFRILAGEGKVVHEFGTKRGKILGAWAAAYRRGMRPMICFVPYDEYRADTIVWKQYPSAMIQKVAESFVLKRQFQITGLVTREELQASEAESVDVRVVEPEAPQEEGDAYKRFCPTIYALGREAKIISDKDIHKILKATTGLDSMKDLDSITFEAMKQAISLRKEFLAEMIKGSHTKTDLLNLIQTTFKKSSTHDLDPDEMEALIDTMRQAPGLEEVPLEVGLER